MPLRIERGEDRLVSTEGVRAPHLFQLSSGVLLLTFHVEADMHFAHRIALRSRDKGETWQRDPDRNHREMAWGEGRDGTVVAFDRDTFEKRPGVFLGIYHRSDDGGETFTGPHECEVTIGPAASHGYPTGPEQYPEESHPLRKFFRPLPDFYKPFVEKASYRRGFSFWRYFLTDGDRWLAMMQGRFHGDTSQRSILVASEDQGRTWEFVSSVPYDPYGTALYGLSEPVMRRVADGSLLCVMRRGGKHPMAQSRSVDNGRSWSPPELIPGHGVDPDLLLLSNGVLACTYGRPGLHIMFSEDGCGYGWGYRTEVGAWRSSAYMGITEIAPGRLLLTYDKVKDDCPEAGRMPEKCHIGATTYRVTRVSVADLKTADPGR